MQKRWHMDNKVIGVETLYTSRGYNQLLNIRKVDGRFKGCRIKEVIQAHPESLPIGECGITYLFRVS